ncbi:molybdenum transporter [Halostagnicola larsenii XH-48]|uniref:Molybdenum transporter n=1 Tax=Halostagnicola larsenii XH-48 TaxID=797299 RepID=W0JTR7_9EURY|nr:substrate-binding domain-containing protein [Halostagnicola larsenii]AHG00408.1 molybdenum transporter [Halostagnicola larsenii XH-48]
MEIPRRSLLVGVGISAASAGCLGRDRSASDGPSGKLTVAVTTSTYDSGLVDELHSAFESAYGVTVRAVSGGTGETIAAGERGDVDAVMAHARSLEDEFIRTGDGINRRDFAVGDFVIAGPADDPAAIASVDDAATAFERIASTESSFLSRGDRSGTHIKEREIWDDAGIDPNGEWYRQTGQGMGETLVQADQRDSYLLTVRGNFIDTREQLDLERFVDGPVTDGDPALENPYGIIAVNPASEPSAAYELAMYYIGFLTGKRGQEIVAEYTVDGEQLFYPNALAEEPNFEQYSPRSSNDSTETALEEVS